MKLPAILTALVAAFFIFVGSSAEAGDPAFPGQPKINTALKHLNAAKEKVPTDANGALGELQEAHNSVAHAIRKKGTYQTIARELIDQATDYLQKGNTDKAAHKIDEAIAAVTKAGETGEH
jgi:tetratricopeptide (TPR) repeat protein